MPIVKNRCFRFQPFLCQNVSNEVLAWFKFQEKIPSRSGACVQGEWQKNTRPSTRLSKDEGLKDIRHSMTIGNLFLRASSVTVSYLIRYDSFLQNKMLQILSQNATAILLQQYITKCVRFFVTKCDSFITKCDSYYKLQQLYCKMRQLLQNAMFITNCDSI